MIVLADDLNPADLILLQHHGVTGFVTEYGGPTSHMSILARSLDIPGVVACIMRVATWSRTNCSSSMVMTAS